jgi:hypothetical protein
MISFGASITIWVPLGIAWLFGTIEKADHPRMFVPPRAFDCGIVQKTATVPNVSLQIAG